MSYGRPPPRSQTRTAESAAEGVGLGEWLVAGPELMKKLNDTETSTGRWPRPLSHGTAPASTSPWLRKMPDGYGLTPYLDAESTAVQP